MVDLTDDERTAVVATMKRVAALMDEIGWCTALADLRESQVCALITASIDGFRTAMSAIAQAEVDAGEVPF